MAVGEEVQVEPVRRLLWLWQWYNDNTHNISFSMYTSTKCLLHDRPLAKTNGAIFLSAPGTFGKMAQLGVYPPQWFCMLWALLQQGDNSMAAFYIFSHRDGRGNLDSPIGEGIMDFYVVSKDKNVFCLVLKDIAHQWVVKVCYVCEKNSLLPSLRLGNKKTETGWFVSFLWLKHEMIIICLGEKLVLGVQGHRRRSNLSGTSCKD